MMVTFSMDASPIVAVFDNRDLGTSMPLVGRPPHRHSLAYDPLFERPPLLADFLYLVLTVTPLIFSERRAINVFGVAVLVTFFVALAANRPAWYSVWCLAAAVFSLVIAFAVEEERSSDFKEVEVRR